MSLLLIFVAVIHVGLALLAWDKSEVFRKAVFATFGACTVLMVLLGVIVFAAHSHR